MILEVITPGEVSDFLFLGCGIDDYRRVSIYFDRVDQYRFLVVRGQNYRLLLALRLCDLLISWSALGSKIDFGDQIRIYPFLGSGCSI